MLTFHLRSDTPVRELLGILTLWKRHKWPFHLSKNRAPRILAAVAMREQAESKKCSRVKFSRAFVLVPPHLMCFPATDAMSASMTAESLPFLLLEPVLAVSRTTSLVLHASAFSGVVLAEGAAAAAGLIVALAVLPRSFLAAFTGPVLPMLLMPTPGARFLAALPDAADASAASLSSSSSASSRGGCASCASSGSLSESWYSTVKSPSLGAEEPKP